LEGDRREGFDLELRRPQTPPAELQLESRKGSVIVSNDDDIHFPLLRLSEVLLI